MILQYIFLSLFLTSALGALMKIRDCPADAVEKPLVSKVVLHSVFIEECIEDPCVVIQGSDITITVNLTTMYQASRVRYSAAVRVPPLNIPVILDENADLCEYLVIGNCKNVTVGEYYCCKRKMKQPKIGVNVEAQVRFMAKDDNNTYTFCGEFGFIVKEKPIAFGTIFAPTIKPSFGQLNRNK